MDFIEYQTLARTTAIYPKKYSIIYPTLGLCGEAGETSEKIKKWLRGGGESLTDEQLQLIRKELGDVLWYAANLAEDLGLSLDEIARENIEKLFDRKERGVLHGSGDIR